MSLLGSKKYDVRKHSNKQRKAAEKTVHFDSTTTPSITSNQSVSYDHSTNQNSSYTDSSREYIWHQNVLDLNRNRKFESENKIIRRIFKVISSYNMNHIDEIKAPPSWHQSKICTSQKKKPEKTVPNQNKSDSPEYSMPPPIEQVNSVLVQNQFQPVETKMFKVKQIKPNLIHDFQIPPPIENSTSQSNRLNGQQTRVPNEVVPDNQSRTKRVSSKSYKPAVKRIG